MVRQRWFLLGFALSVFLSGTAFGQITWIGGGESNNFADVNWATTPPFDGTDQLTIDLGTFPSGITSMVSGTVHIDTLTIQNTGSPSSGLDLTNCGTLLINTGLIDSTADSVIIDAALAGGGRLTVNGGGVLQLTNGGNSYSGGTSVTNGSTVDLGASGALGSGSVMLSGGTHLTAFSGDSITVDNSISLCGGGTVHLLEGTMGATLTLTGMISGNSTLEIASAGCGGTNVVEFDSSCSNFCGGVQVDAGNTVVIVGASSTGSSGPLGTGTLVLTGGAPGEGNVFRTAGGGCYTIDNAIQLCGGGTVNLLEGGMGTNLSLTGMISGSSNLEIYAAGCGGQNTVEFSSTSSSFCGGVSVDCGNTILVVSGAGDGSSGPLGTGILALNAGNTLRGADSGNNAISNAITLSGSCNIYVGGTSSGSSLTLNGMITGCAPLVINAADCGANTIAFTSSCSTFSGGVTVMCGNTVLAVGGSGSSSAGALGTGLLTLNGGNTLTGVDSNANRIDNAIQLNGSNTIYLMGGGSGTDLTLGGMITGCAPLEVQAAECGNNVISFLSGCSTFSGGVTVDCGGTSILIGGSSVMCGSTVMSGPLGTGTLTLNAGNNLSVVDTCNYTIGNAIQLNGGSTINIFSNTYGANLTLSGMISGCAPLYVSASLDCTPDILTLTSSCSTFSGGITLGGGNADLIVGSSTTMCGNTVMSGPLGTGTLTMNSGSDLSTLDSSCYTIGNAIQLNGGTATVFENNTEGAMLTLSGMISGCGTLEIAAAGCDTNSLTLSSACSTFSGGVTVDAGNTKLVVAASGSGSPGAISSSPLGTGTLTMGDGTTLTTPSLTCITVLNDIVLGSGPGSSTVTLGDGSSGTLTLEGQISNYCAPGALIINGPVDLEGCNSYSGGTTVNATTLTVGSNLGLGLGNLTANSGTVKVTAPSATIYGALLNGSASLNFNAGSTPTLIDMVSNTLGDAASSINLGNDDLTRLTIQVDADPTFYGTINGNGSLKVTTSSQGMLELAGANTYTGGTTASPATLIIASNNAAFGTGPVTLCSTSALAVNYGICISNPISMPNDNVKMLGYGTINPSQTLTFQSGSGFTGGLGTIGTTDISHPIIGTLNFGGSTTVALGGGGAMEFSIMNAVGTAGTDFSAVNVQNTLDLGALAPTSPFSIYIVGVGSSGLTWGCSNTFDNTQAYHWTLLSANSISGTFNASSFLIDNSTYFYNQLNGGSFSVSLDGTNPNDIDLNFTPVPEPSTWALLASGLTFAGGGIYRRRRKS